jgi:hypothetical protein
MLSSGSSGRGHSRNGNLDGYEEEAFVPIITVSNLKKKLDFNNQFNLMASLPSRIYLS